MNINLRQKSNLAETKTAKSDKPNTPPVIAKDPPDAISPYVSCRRQGRADTNHPCNAAEAQRLADEQGYELKTGPYGGKQEPKKQD